jgi:hypothetical protein
MKFREPPALTPGQRCGAKLRNKPGQFCRRYPLMGHRRCALHGGLTPRGKNSVHYKTGINSRYLPEMLKEKIEKLNTSNPLDLIPELSILRGLLDTYLEEMQRRHDSTQEKDKVSLSAEINIISELITRIALVVDKIVKIRNDTALTASEVKLLGIRIAESTAKYIPDETVRAKFLEEIFTTALPSENTEYPYIESYAEPISD